jgi:hypothetical protein
VIRLTRLQNTLADSGLVTRDKTSLYIQNGKPQYTPETDEHVFRMDYEAVLLIEDFTGEIWLLSLILEDSVQEIWPSQCSSASVQRLDTDPLNTPETDLAYLIRATETYRLTPITETVPDATCVRLSGGLFRADPVDTPPLPLPEFRGIVIHDPLA